MSSWLGAAALVLLLAACTPSPSPSATATTPQTSEAGTPTAACAPIDLRTPTGEQVDLAGTWIGGDGVVVANQYGECVWWELLSNAPGEALGASYRRLYFGRIQLDLTIEARFGDILTADRPVQTGHVVQPEGEVICEIDVRTEAGTETVVLRVPKLESIETGVWPLVDYERISLDTTLADM